MPPLLLQYGHTCTQTEVEYARYHVCCNRPLRHSHTTPRHIESIACPMPNGCMKPCNTMEPLWTADRYQYLYTCTRTSTGNRASILQVMYLSTTCTTCIRIVAVETRVASVSKEFFSFFFYCVSMWIFVCFRRDRNDSVWLSLVPPVAELVWRSMWRPAKYTSSRDEVLVRFLESIAARLM